jgi:hypothetical protein
MVHRVDDSGHEVDVPLGCRTHRRPQLVVSGLGNVERLMKRINTRILATCITALFVLETFPCTYAVHIRAVNLIDGKTGLRPPLVSNVIAITLTP